MGEGEGVGGDGGDGRDGRGALRGSWGVVGGGRDDRAGRPTPERFHESRVSKHGRPGQRMQAGET